jgi:hypothetical protein
VNLGLGPYDSTGGSTIRRQRASLDPSCGESTNSFELIEDCKDENQSFFSAPPTQCSGLKWTGALPWWSLELELEQTQTYMTQGQCFRLKWTGRLWLAPSLGNSTGSLCCLSLLWENSRSLRILRAINGLSSSWTTTGAFVPRKTLVVSWPSLPAIQCGT